MVPVPVCGVLADVKGFVYNDFVESHFLVPHRDAFEKNYYSFFVSGFEDTYTWFIILQDKHLSWCI